MTSLSLLAGRTVALGVYISSFLLQSRHDRWMDDCMDYGEKHGWTSGGNMPLHMGESSKFQKT